jgi:hypothetical protein
VVADVVAPKVTYPFEFTDTEVYSAPLKTKANGIVIDPTLSSHPVPKPMAVPEIEE